MLAQRNLLRRPNWQCYSVWEWNISRVETTGHFLLTSLLLDKLKASSPSRIVNTVGVGYDQTNIDFEDFNMEKADLRRGEAYNRSKLAMAMFTVELAKRIEGYSDFFITLCLCSTIHLEFF